MQSNLPESEPMKSAFIIDGVRTPIGRHAGGLSTVRSDDLAALTIKEAASKLPPEALQEIDDVIFGCANQAGEDNRNVARMALLLAGLPYAIPGETVNRLCASGMSAVVHAQRAIASGDGSLFIAGGVEHMTRAPFVMAKAQFPFSGTAEIYNTSIGWRFPNPKMKQVYGLDSMGQTAENLADMFGISREEQDHFACSSQMKAAGARENGRLSLEIIQVEAEHGREGPEIIKDDEFIRPGTTVDVLSRLKPVFRFDGKGTVTAGNSSGINDGAAALVVASEDAVKKYDLKPKARIAASAVAGVEPRIMGIGPVAATEMVMKKSGLTLSDMSVIEINEAFAAQCIACLKSLKIDPEDKRVNPNGGAIALGHPLGMSGARLLLTAAIELNLLKEKYALCTMCIGVGQGMAVVLERI